MDTEHPLKTININPTTLYESYSTYFLETKTEAENTTVGSWKLFHKEKRKDNTQEEIYWMIHEKQIENLDQKSICETANSIHKTLSIFTLVTPS